MKDEVLYPLLIAACGLGFLLLMGGIVYSTHVQNMAIHAERAECIKARGDWIERACRFKQ